MFNLNKEQLSKYTEWIKEHNKTCKYTDPMKQGAIGGRITFSFTPTGLGTLVQVKCMCGEVYDLSDCENW